MATYPKAAVSITAVLAAAIVLHRIHGFDFATSFLKEYGIDDEVIDELLNQPYHGQSEREKFPRHL